MHPESENFEQLKRLLTLKRHEVPPPGYFNNFSREVISRLRAAQAETVSFGATSWLQRLWNTLELRPAFAGAFGVAVCALLLAGVLYSGKTDERPLAGIHLEANSPMAALTENSSFPLGQSTVQPTLASGVGSLMGTPQASGSLFDQFQIQVQPASFHPVGN